MVYVPPGAGYVEVETWEDREIHNARWRISDIVEIRRSAPDSRVPTGGEPEQEKNDHGAGLAAGDADTTVVPAAQLSHAAKLPFRAYASGQIDLIDATGRVFGVVDGDFSSADDRANADFIVRACNTHDEMLAALKWAYDYFEDRAFSSHRVILGNAINKAEGR